MSIMLQDSSSSETVIGSFAVTRPGAGAEEGELGKHPGEETEAAAGQGQGSGDSSSIRSGMSH